MIKSEENASSSEDDYMSESVILSAQQHKSSKINRTSAHARRLDIEKCTEEANRANWTMKKGEVEKETREKALNTPLETTGKGFAMLAKMGYKPGTSLGKQSDGILQPIKPEMKSGRQGFGHDTVHKRKLEATWKVECHRASKRVKEEATTLVDYRIRKQADNITKRVAVDFAQARKTCRHLDAELESPKCTWFWPKLPNRPSIHDDPHLGHDVAQDVHDDVEDEDEEPEPSDGLPILLNYLRCEHLYCIYCGCTFEDQDDMLENCPGETRAEHD